MPLLPKLETSLYFGIWISGVTFSLYNLHLFGRVFNEGIVDSYQYEDFCKGWKILGEEVYQDQADYEWNSWTQLTVKLIPFLLCNLIVSELIRHKDQIFLLPIWYTVVTITFVIYNFNFIISIWFISLAVIYYICLYFRSLTLVWSITILIIHCFKPELWFAVSEDDKYLILISSSWMILRCISFCIDKIKESSCQEITLKKHASEILLMLGYSLYLPTMFFGPFIMYSYFDEGINSGPGKWDLKRVFSNVKTFSRCCFWFFFTEFALHFIYVNAILLRPHLVEDLLDWELAGLGIAMGHFFHLKYVVFYGIPCAWAAAERFTVPEVPCCVSRVHLYSQMWRRFDHGLYQFLLKYIYIPVASIFKGNALIRKTPASIACFMFVFLWHRGETNVFYWVLFNFLAVTIEALGKELFNLSIVNKYFVDNISQSNIQRIQCLLITPLHYFSMVSNFFFIGNGMNVGLIYLNKFFNGSVKSTLTVLFFLYGAGQSAVAIQKWEETNKSKQKTN